MFEPRVQRTTSEKLRVIRERVNEVNRLTGTNSTKLAEFVAHAREDLPKLVDEVEDLQAECAAMRKALETIVFHEHNYDAYSTAVDIAQEALGKLREQVAE